MSYVVTLACFGGRVKSHPISFRGRAIHNIDLASRYVRSHQRREQTRKLTKNIGSASWVDRESSRVYLRSTMRPHKQRARQKPPFAIGGLLTRASVSDGVPSPRTGERSQIDPTMGACRSYTRAMIEKRRWIPLLGAILLFFVTTAFSAIGIANWRECASSNGIFAGQCWPSGKPSTLGFIAFLLVGALGAGVLLVAIVFHRKKS